MESVDHFDSGVKLDFLKFFRGAVKTELSDVIRKAVRGIGVAPAQRGSVVVFSRVMLQHVQRVLGRQMDSRHLASLIRSQPELGISFRHTRKGNVVEIPGALFGEVA